MTAPSGIVTLLTDFGHRDPFVGMVKGVILGRFPAARIVDLTHEIPPYDVRAGAYWPARSYAGFPAGTVHVAVVDPGVGTSRAVVVAEARDQWLVVPDNGLCAELAARDGLVSVHMIDRVACRLGEPSRTFHGRDLLAPVAAMLASGALSPEAVGPATRLEGPRWERAVARPDGIEGRVIVRDRFGNLLTDVPAEAVERLANEPGPVPGQDPSQAGPWVWIGDRAVPWRRTYADVTVGALVALDNAHGDLEIAAREGNAAELLGAGPGTPVRVRRAAWSPDRSGGW